MRAPRIGLVIGHLTHGGSERMLFDTAIRLPDIGFDPVVFCLSDAYQPYGEMLSARGVPVHCLYRNSHFDLWRAYQLRQGLDLECINLVHAWHVSDNAYAALACLGRQHRHPLVASMRSRELDRDALRRRVDRWALRRANAVVANHAQVIQHLKEDLDCPRDKIRLVPNGIPETRWKAKSDRTSVRKHHTTPEEAVVLLFVGRLEAVKNLPFLLITLARLREMHPEVYLWLAGEGSERSNLVEQSLELGLDSYVRFLGERDDIADLWQAADLGVLCSRSEGLPNSILEALSCGRPVVVCPEIGCEGLVEPERTGWIASEGTVPGYVATLLSALEGRDRWSEMGRLARESVRAEYSIDKMLHRLKDLYQGLLAETGTPQLRASSQVPVSSTLPKKPGGPGGDRQQE